MSEVTEQAVVVELRPLNVLHINAARLDPIRATLENIGPSEGLLMVQCYNQAWTAWWCGMGDRTLEQFICSVSADYLAENLLRGTPHYGSLADESEQDAQDSRFNYVRRIAEALKRALATLPLGQAVAVCNWAQQDSGGDCYSTGCGHEFMVLGDEPPDWPRCNYCGKPMVAHAWADDDVEDDVPESPTPIALQPAFDPSSLFDASLQPELDEYGFTNHPDIDRFMVGHDGGEWKDGDDGVVSVEGLRAAGWEPRFVAMDDDVDEAVLDAWLDRGEPGAPTWDPTPPEGDGWRLVARYDTEDGGPAAMFVRPLKCGQADTNG